MIQPAHPVPGSTNIVYRPATAYEFPSVARLYDEGGYDGRYQASDFLLLALCGSEVVGVVRLVHEQGYTLLRGLYVGRDWRRRGLGRGLLGATIDHLRDPCYCLVPESLIDLFGAYGFLLCPDDIAPSFLLERRTRYGWTGKRYHVLYRPD
jgi:GNAT superfamily N-acetyltransferase